MDEPTDTGNEPSWKRVTISSTESERSMNPLRAQYATVRAKLLIGCYRKGEANDPDLYVSAVAAVLTLYEPEIIRQATDPRIGIQTVEKFVAFMPNAGELKAFCEALAARQARIAGYQSLPPARPVVRRPMPPSDPAPGPDGKHASGTILANYDEAFRIYGRPMGDESPRKDWHPPPYTGPAFVPYTDDELRRLYGTRK